MIGQKILSNDYKKKQREYYKLKKKHITSYMLLIKVFDAHRLL